MPETALNVWFDCIITSVVNKEMNTKKINPPLMIRYYV